MAKQDPNEQYEDTIENITKTDAPLEAANDKGRNILIYPGSSKKDSWLPGLSALLQTGKYDVVMSAGQTYTNSSVVIDEVEKQFNKNIKVVSVGSLQKFSFKSLKPHILLVI